MLHFPGNAPNTFPCFPGRWRFLSGSVPAHQWKGLLPAGLSSGSRRVNPCAPDSRQWYPVVSGGAEWKRPAGEPRDYRHGAGAGSSLNRPVGRVWLPFRGRRANRRRAIGRWRLVRHPYGEYFPAATCAFLRYCRALSNSPATQWGAS